MEYVANTNFDVILDAKVGGFITGLNQASNSVDKLSKKLEVFNHSSKKLETSMNKMAADVSAGMEDVSKKQGDVTSGFRQMQRATLMFGLSMMFFGMQMKRIFQGMVFNTLSFYQKVYEGSTVASQGVAQLSAGYDMLKLSVGDAVAEFLTQTGILELLLNIVDGVVDWIDQNEELTAGLLIAGLAAGTLMMAAGQIGLFLNGIVGMGTAMGITWTGLGTIITGTLLPAIGLLAAAWVLWESDFAGFKGTVKSVADTFYLAFDTAIKFVSSLLSEVFGVAISVLKGDWEGFTKHGMRLLEVLTLGFGSAIAIMMMLMWDLGEFSAKVFGGIGHSLQEGVIVVVGEMYNLLVRLAKPLAKISDFWDGVLGDLEEVDIEAAKRSHDFAQNKFYEKMGFTGKNFKQDMRNKITEGWDDFYGVGEKVNDVSSAPSAFPYGANVQIGMAEALKATGQTSSYTQQPEWATEYYRNMLYGNQQNQGNTITINEMTVKANDPEGFLDALNREIDFTNEAWNSTSGGNN